MTTSEHKPDLKNATGNACVCVYDFYASSVLASLAVAHLGTVSRSETVDEIHKKLNCVKKSIEDLLVNINRYKDSVEAGL